MQAEAAVLSDWWRIKWEDVKINNQVRSLSAGSVAKVSILNETSKPPVNKTHFFNITHLLLNCLK